MGLVTNMNEYQYQKWQRQSFKTKQKINEQYENLTLFDKSTGQIYEGVDFEIHPNIGGATYQQKDYMQSKSALAEHNREMGGFIFTIYRLAEHMDKEITKADLARLLFMATYLNYDNELRFDNGTAITKKHLPELLGLKDKAFRTFYNKVVSFGVLIETERGLKLNDDYFVKGELKPEIKNGEIPYVRTYNKTIRDLYAMYGTTRKAGNLGLVYLVIPFIHKGTNILASNPKEKDYAWIEPINLQDLAKILKYSPDKIKSALLSISLGSGNDLEYVFTVTEMGGNEKYTYVNSKVLWRGNNLPHEVNPQEVMLAIKKRKKLN